MNSTLAYSTATPSVAQRNRDEVARMLAAGRRADERAAREARAAARVTRIAAGYVGHVTMVESDDYYGRHWSTFPATPEGAREAAEYIVRLESAGELSDIDCATTCPCTRERYPELFED